MRIILIALLGCMLAAPAGLSGRLDASQDKPGTHANPRPPSNWWKTEKYRQELRLTADQSAAIEEIVQTSLARLKADKGDLDRAQSDFRMLMDRPNATERELLKAAERLEMARYSISKERTAMVVRIHSVLTPDQRRGLDVIAKRYDAERSRR